MSYVFTPRLTDKGMKTSEFYNEKSHNSFCDGKNNLPNCTCYAMGRAMELQYEVTKKVDKDLIFGNRNTLGNAKTWYTDVNPELKRGSTPKLGAIVVFDGTAGHVGVVEKVNGTKFIISYSEKNGVYFDTIELNVKVGQDVPSQHWGDLLGFIYLPWEFVADDLAQYTDEELADMVIAGKFGNGEDRKEALGDRYTAVQTIVNDKLSGKKSVDEVAKEVIEGKWGNGEERKERLTTAGYDFTVVQTRVNELMK